MLYLCHLHRRNGKKVIFNLLMLKAVFILASPPGTPINSPGVTGKSYQEKFALSH